VLKRYSRDMYQLATTDGLTGVRNKQYLFEEGPDFVKKRQPASLMMVDVDRFEQINDTRGHIIGDHVLHMLGQLLNRFFPSQGASQGGIVSRFGGKKYTILLGNCPCDAAKQKAAELQAEVIALKPEGVEITVSLGIACAQDAKENNFHEMIAEADHALGLAKQQGYNQIHASRDAYPAN
jgi:diguanylate cyclase (GGDEF)-like protein